MCYKCVPVEETVNSQRDSISFGVKFLWTQDSVLVDMGPLWVVKVPKQTKK